MPTAFRATVTEKSEGEKGAVISFDIPAFGSKYPVKISRIPPGEASALVVGQPVTILLEQGRPKKEGVTGHPYDYWWDWAGIGEFSVAEPEPAKGETPAEAAPGWIAERRSIERQVAFKGAVELVCCLLQAGKLPEAAKASDYVVELTNKFARAIAQAPREQS